MWGKETTVCGAEFCACLHLSTSPDPRGAGVQRAESSILPALHKHIRDGTRGRGEERKGPRLTDRAPQTARQQL